jgi:hypothetical protein
VATSSRADLSVREKLPPGRRYEVAITVKLRWRSFARKEAFLRASRIENTLAKIASFVSRTWEIDMSYEVGRMQEARRAKAK